jgi:hypothetical protein
VRKLFKGGKYSRAETIRGNKVLASERPQNKNRHNSLNQNLSPVFYFHGLTLKKCLTDLKARYLHEPNGTFTQVVSPLCKTIVHYGKVNMNYLHK